MTTEELAEEIKKLEEQERIRLLDILKKIYCLKCGEQTDGKQCWGCFESGPLD